MVIIVTQIDFFRFPTAYFFVAFITDFLADQNVMIRVGGDLTFHLKNNTFAGHSFWNMNLNGIKNISTTVVKVFRFLPKQESHAYDGRSYSQA